MRMSRALTASGNAQQRRAYGRKGGQLSLYQHGGVNRDCSHGNRVQHDAFQRESMGLNDLARNMVDGGTSTEQKGSIPP
jgi:hypothetical protein